MSDTSEPVTCECGAEMELEKSWTRKSIPLIGSEMEFRDYACPECGEGTRLKRKESSGNWRRVPA